LAPSTAEVMANVGGQLGRVIERQRTQVSLRASNDRLQATLEELRGAEAIMIKQERLRALGQMASGLAHDMNNALTPMVGFSELLLLKPELAGTDRERAYLKSIYNAAQKAAGMVRRLRSFYAPQGPPEDMEPLDLREIINQAIG